MADEDEEEFERNLRLAEQGDADAQFEVGWMYAHGTGVSRNDGEAARWFRMAADQGDADAQRNLGWMYAHGLGVDRDDREAVYWYRQAAEQEHPDAQCDLGWMYEHGRGVIHDDKEAVRWYRKAAEQGQAVAQCRLGGLYEEGQGVEQDDWQARHWYRKAAEQGHPGAIMELERHEIMVGPLEDDPPAEADASAPNDLSDLIGIASVKAQVESLTQFIRVQNSRRAAGLKTPALSLHLIFTGNPGTGKTTVARRIGSIYRRLGLLQKGHVIECQRQDLVGEYIGHTAPKVRRKCDAAMDGVLFIDEAYSLMQPNSDKDFGSEAIAALVAEMENRRDRLVVIVAGHTQEMKAFLDANPGLRSRFWRTLHFEDYTAGELLEIFERFAIDGDYRLDAQARSVLLGRFEKSLAGRTRTFGNARHARNLFEQALEKHAARVGRLADPDCAALQTITAFDLP